MKSARLELFGVDLFRLMIYVAAAAFCLMFSGLLTGKERFIDDTIAWYGSFPYYVESLANGHFPYWDPYMMTGSYFYPNVSHHGLLEPVVLVFVLLRKTFGISLLTLYCYFLIFRLVVFSFGTYLFYRYVTKSNMSAAVAALVLFFAIPATDFLQAGVIDVIYLSPFALYFCLLFFDTPTGRKKYIYLFCVALISGISLNIYIPAYYLFNLTFFVIVVSVLRLISIGEFARFVQRKTPFLAIAAAILLIVMMAAPPLLVMFKDASGGELFPLLRIAHKNDNNLKKIVASEVNTSSLSGKFTNNMGVFNSYGNLANLLYPNIGDIAYFENHKIISEIKQYIGIIPLIFCVLGFIYSKSRFRWLAIIMAALSAINMFSFSGIISQPYNILQNIFNEIFPPLKMIECRETFGAFFLFYLCLLLSLGLKLVFEGEVFREIAEKKYWQILVVCSVFIGLKILITGYFGRMFVFSSSHDLFVLSLVILFLFMIMIYSRRHITKKLFVVVVLVFISSDLLYYNYIQKSSSLAPRHDLDYLIKKYTRTSSNFQFFREPIIAPPHLAFAESILQTKGVLVYASNHTLFSTKRYYDLLTNTPVENQLAIGGVSRPIVRFFPANDVVGYDRKQALQYYAQAKDDEIADRLLIETTDEPDMSAGLGEIKDFKNYEDIYELDPEREVLQEFVSWYSTEQGKDPKNDRNNLDRYFRTPEYSLAVERFSPNDITISLQNTTGGYLYYGDGWSKYWRAFDGNQEIPLRIANYNSKAVFLGKGTHSVRFVFDPVHYKVGLALYYCALSVLCGVISFLCLTKKEWTNQ